MSSELQHFEDPDIQTEAEAAPLLQRPLVAWKDTFNRYQKTENAVAICSTSKHTHKTVHTHTPLDFDFI